MGRLLGKRRSCVSIFVFFCSAGESEGLERQRRTGVRDKAELGGVTPCQEQSLQTEQGKLAALGKCQMGSVSVNGELR